MIRYYLTRVSPQDSNHREYKAEREKNLERKTTITARTHTPSSYSSITSAKIKGHPTPLSKPLPFACSIDNRSEKKKQHIPQVGEIEIEFIDWSL